MSGVVSGLGSVWEAITSLPSQIINGLKSFFDNVVNAIKALPDTIIDGIRSIFIPDTDVIQFKFESFLDEMKMKFSFNTDFFENLFSGEAPVTDVITDISIPNVGTFKLKLFDSKYFIDGVTYFRPFIRGFLILLLALYNIKQILSFFRQDAGVITGKAVDMATSVNEKGGKK